MANWVKELLRNLDQHVDDETKKKILGACGEKCPFTHLTDEKLLEIKSNSANDTDFLNNLCKEWRMVKEGGEYYVVFDQCYCPLVNDDLQGTSESLCLCTLGNLEKKFAIGLEQEATVHMLKTILKGDSECRFHIQLQGTPSQ